MSEPCSSTLFANANCNHDSSPTAYVSATLASSIKQRRREKDNLGQNVFALTFFCANHTDQDDANAGPCGLMRSFVSQLLTYYSYSPSTLRQVNYVNGDDIQDLCLLFKTLVSHLPQSTILFCLVDGATVYETRTAYQQDADALLKSLVEIVRCEKRGPVVKLWLSASSNSRSLRALLSDEEILSLPSAVPRTGGLFGVKNPMG